MCGFAAILAFSDFADELIQIDAMGAELAHRGPDDEGVFRGRRGAFAFRRLAILDLSPAGHQPMLSADGAYAMVFNGEIFNFVELRQELKEEGWRFKSSGDAEVLLVAYQAWGERCLNKLNGMFSFVILDLRTGQAFAARDRAGIKPLYYARTDRAIFLASEPKSIVVATGASLDTDRLAQYLCAGRTDNLDWSTRTYFKGVFELQAAHSLALSGDGELVCRRYWEIPAESSALALRSDVDLTEEYRDRFYGAIALQLRSDVPVGITLSGGVDSTSVACVAHRQLQLAGADSSQLTFFSFHTPRFDESQYREEVMARSGGRSVVITSLSEDVIDRNRFLIAHHDEPLHSPTALVNAELYRAAQSDGVKVLLGGAGCRRGVGGLCELSRRGASANRSGEGLDGCDA